MSTSHLLVWNVCGLNSRARRDVVREFVVQHRVSVLCVQETKVANFTVPMLHGLTGSCFDYMCLPAVGASGGALVAWRRDLWGMSQPVVRSFSLTLKLRPLDWDGIEWWLTNVYGPANRVDKPAFLTEIRDTRAAHPGPWLICGDFNVIYQAADKSNGRLHRGLMRDFCRVIDDLQLADIHLSDRSFTWSNERGRPTMERLDRALASVEWIDMHPNFHLSSLSSDCSDHAPLLLVLDAAPCPPPWYRFHGFWTKMEGFLDLVMVAWSTNLPDADACQALDHKLRYVALALKSWNAAKVGSIRLQLAVARMVIRELNIAQEHRLLSDSEIELRRELKANTLGLASLNRNMARQRARSRFLRKGDTSTRFFLLQAYHRHRKNYLAAVHHNGQLFTKEDAKSDLVHDYYYNILGKPFIREHTIDLSQLQLPRLDLSDQAVSFTLDEVARIVRESPSDRAPGPDGFSAGFFQSHLGHSGC